MPRNQCGGAGRRAAVPISGPKGGGTNDKAWKRSEPGPNLILNGGAGDFGAVGAAVGRFLAGDKIAGPTNIALSQQVI